MLHAAGVGVAPVAFRADLGEAHDDGGLVVCICRLACGRGASAKEQAQDQQQRQCAVFHRDSPSFSAKLRFMGSRMDTVEPLPAVLSKDRP